MQISRGYRPVGPWGPPLNEVLVKLELPPGKVAMKGLADIAVSPLHVTVIGWGVAPVGAVTVKVFAEAPFTVARTPPKYTILLVSVVLKFAPAIVTVVPAGPEEGEKPVIRGGCAAQVTASNRGKSIAIV